MTRRGRRPPGNWRARFALASSVRPGANRKTGPPPERLARSLGAEREPARSCILAPGAVTGRVGSSDLASARELTSATVRSDAAARTQRCVFDEREQLTWNSRPDGVTDAGGPKTVNVDGLPDHRKRGVEMFRRLKDGVQGLKSTPPKALADSVPPAPSSAAVASESGKAPRMPPVGRRHGLKELH